MTVYRDKLL